MIEIWIVCLNDSPEACFSNKEKALEYAQMRANRREPQQFFYLEGPFKLDEHDR